MFDGFYRKSFGDLKKSLENIFDVLPIIQTFYSHSFDKRNMTRLLFSCFSQIIMICVNYLTNNKSIEFWAQSDDVMIEKLTKCIEFKVHVVYCIVKMKKKISVDDLIPFESILSCAFKSFVLFVNRLEKVSGLFEIAIILKKNTRGRDLKLIPVIAG